MRCSPAATANAWQGNGCGWQALLGGQRAARLLLCSGDGREAGCCGAALAFEGDGTAGQHPSASASADAGGWERAAVQRLMKMVLLGSVHPRVGRGWEIVDNQLALPLTTTCRVMVNGGASAGVLRWFAMCKERASARVGAVTNWEQSFRARPACVGACLIWSPIGGRGAFRRAAVPGRRSSVDG